MPSEFFLLYFLGAPGVLVGPQAALGLSVIDPWRIDFLLRTEGDPAADARGDAD